MNKQISDNSQLNVFPLISFFEDLRMVNSKNQCQTKPHLSGSISVQIGCICFVSFLFICLRRLDTEPQCVDS